MKKIRFDLNEKSDIAMLKKDLRYLGIDSSHDFHVIEAIREETGGKPVYYHEGTFFEALQDCVEVLSEMSILDLEAVACGAIFSDDGHYAGDHVAFIPGNFWVHFYAIYGD